MECILFLGSVQVLLDMKALIPESKMLHTYHVACIADEHVCETWAVAL